MKSYSPYDNVRAQNYPHLLVTVGFNDSMVQYYEPTKLVASLGAHKTDHNSLLLKINLGAGHGGSSGRHDHHHEAAYEFGFVIDRLAAS